MKKSEDFVNLTKKFETKRLQTASNICEFFFLKQRVNLLTKVNKVNTEKKYVIYWMARDIRIQDNWALLFAQNLAIKHKKPIMIIFLLESIHYHATSRFFSFLFDGLKEVESDCNYLKIKFKLSTGNITNYIEKLMKKNCIASIITDFSPLKKNMNSVNSVLNVLSSDIPFYVVDAHNIVPVWIASNKEEYSARTLRPKINSQLHVYLTEFPPVINNNDESFTGNNTDWIFLYNELKKNNSIQPVMNYCGGYSHGVKHLEIFCKEKLKYYKLYRNNPCYDVLSNLSPWFHFGNISVQRCVLEVQSYLTEYPESVKNFIEEAVIRRELADNFCYYNRNYDNLSGLPIWSRTTLEEHKDDIREYLYNLNQFEFSETHDDLWNAAQIQLKLKGKMHGYLRMYWAKKILEWSKSPVEAIDIAIELNDKYSLDGCDPNGYVGCLWSIGGLHDQGWKERNVFGKIRYMNYSGCKRKFDVKKFISEVLKKKNE